MHRPGTSQRDSDRRFSDESFHDWRFRLEDAWAEGLDVKLERGRYRFAFRVRGTAGLPVEFEVVDGWRSVGKEAKIALSPEWKEHVVEFDIKNAFKDDRGIRFVLPRDTKGVFDVTDTRLSEL